MSEQVEGDWVLAPEEEELRNNLVKRKITITRGAMDEQVEGDWVLTPEEDVTLPPRSARHRFRVLYK